MSRFFQCAKGLIEIYVYLSIIYIINTFSESSKRFVHFFMGTIENVYIRYLSELLGLGKSDGERTYHGIWPRQPNVLLLSVTKLEAGIEIRN